MTNDLELFNCCNNEKEARLVKEAIDYIVNNYNIPRNRFILNFGGEESPLVSGLKEGYDTSNSDEFKHYMNRRVEFHVATATDTDMERPEGPEAGKNTPGSARSGSKYSGNYNSGY